MAPEGESGTASEIAEVRDNVTIVGVVSDTHGVLRDRVLEMLSGCHRILHAGDVGDPEVLRGLERVAPVLAVRGNVDTEPPLGDLPVAVRHRFGPWHVGMTHIQDDLQRHQLDDCDIQVFGHSHKPALIWEGRRLLLNPGACGRRRFHLPLTVARLTFREQGFVPELLDVAS